MTKKYEANILPAQPMNSIGDYRWFARARVRQIETGRDYDFIRIPGEWHGKTSQEAESKALRAAQEWIAQHTE